MKRQAHRPTKQPTNPPSRPPTHQVAYHPTNPVSHRSRWTAGDIIRQVNRLIEFKIKSDIMQLEYQRHVVGYFLIFKCFDIRFYHFKKFIHRNVREREQPYNKKYFDRYWLLESLLKRLWENNVIDYLFWKLCHSAVSHGVIYIDYFAIMYH